MAGSSWTNQVQNQVIIAGPAGQLLVYTPSVGLGNLVGSIRATATTDSAGNAVLAGVVGYSKVGGNFYAVQSGGTGVAAVTAYYTATSAAGPWTLRATIQADAAGFELNSQGPLVLATGGSSQAVTASQSAGLQGGIPVTQVDRTQLSVGNTATAADLTTLWSIPAHDGDNGAKYTIETAIKVTTGATTVQTLTIGADINNGISGGGTLVPLATLGTAFNGSALSTTYLIPVRLTLVPAAGNSASNPEIILSGPLGDTSASRLATNSANMSGYSDTAAWNPANLNTLSLYAVWGGAGGTGQLAAANWSEFTRSGQN